MEETTSKIVRSSTRRPRETPEQRRRKKIIQISLGVAVVIAIAVLAVIGNKTNPKAAYILVIGVSLGYVLQRSRFCFTASLRDPVLTGGTNLTKAVIIGLGAISLLFMAYNISHFGLDLSTVVYKEAAGKIKPAGLHTALGAFIFGIGAVISGGCASGTLMRMGEGFIQQWIVIITFIAGSVIGIALLPYVVSKSAKPVFIPEVVGGWLPAIIIHFAVLLGLYIIADMWGKRNSQG